MLSVLRRSQLYVPGNNEKMIMKASSLDCDSVILDLEDAVPSAQKERARSLVRKMASELDWGKKEVCVRTNSVATRWGKADLDQLRSVDRLDSLVIPKAEEDLTRVYKQTGKRLIPIIETAEGLEEIGTIVCSRGVDAVSFGAADFAFSVAGSVDSYLENPYVKTRIVVAARSVGIEPIDNVFFDLKDREGFRRQALHARALGFSGKQLIHPSQVSVANEVFSPKPSELRWARGVIKQYERAKGRAEGAFSLDGKLIDAVHYKIAKRLLKGSDRTSGNEHEGGR